jgi:chaperone BCS1
MFDTLKDLFLHNQLFTGGFLLMISGAAMALCRKLPLQIWSLVKRRFILKVEVLNNDQVFQWLKIWLDAQPYSKKARALSVSSAESDSSRTSPVPVSQSPESKRPRPKLIFTPAPGVHFFFYKNRFIWLERTRSEATDKEGWTSYRESFQIRVFGRSQDVVRSLIIEAMELALPPEDLRVSIFANAGDYWRQVALKQPRNIDSVILPCDTLDGLLSDVNRFTSSELYYTDLGIPYRRGYLLYGVPGSGKTSSIVALAGALRMNLYILNLADRWMTDDILNRLLADTSERSILLLEDVDAVFTARQSTDPRAAGISFSGLLNALDGAASREGRILFMTTNHAEKLDPALIRPGRADVHIEFSYATQEQIIKFFIRFFPDSSRNQAEQYAYSYTHRDVAMAEIQQHLLENRDSLESALASAAPKYLSAVAD